MKARLPSCLLLAGLFAAGCAAQNKTIPTASAAKVPPSLIVTPDNSISGKVIYYDSAGQFVVLNFPAGQMPKIRQILFLYRSGLKTAEVKITGPQGYGNIVADLLTGDARVGDEVRDQ